MAESILTPQQTKQAQKIQSLIEGVQNKGIRDTIYLLKCKEFYKIGYTKHFSSRLNTIQNGNPFNIDVVVVKKHKLARFLEKSLHEQLAQFRHSREWYLFPDGFIEQLKVFIENYE